MAEEDVRAAVQQALKEVEHYSQKIKEIEARPDFTGSEPQYHAFKESLKEARGYHLSLTHAPPALTPTADPFFSQIGIAKEDNDKKMLTFPSLIPLYDKTNCKLVRRFQDLNPKRLVMAMTTICQLWRQIC